MDSLTENEELRVRLREAEAEMSGVKHELMTVRTHLLTVQHLNHTLAATVAKRENELARTQSAACGWALELGRT